MADIFLSYDHDDQARITPLVGALERCGWNIWWDHRILPGQTWDQTIQNALDQARCVVVVWTRFSVQSDWVRIEASNGHERRILVPVMLEAVTLPLAFQLVQAAPLFDWDGSADDARFLKLAAGIRAVLGDGVAAAPAPPSPPEPRALDAGIGRQLQLNEPAHLIAMIRRARSLGLKAILEAEESDVAPEDVVSRPFDLNFRTDPAGRPLPAELTIRVSAPDFDPPAQYKKVRVAPERDSAVFDFLLVPRKAGPLVVQVEAYEDDVCLVSRVLKPSAVEGLMAVRAARLVATAPLHVAVKDPRPSAPAPPGPRKRAGDSTDPSGARLSTRAHPQTRVGVWKPPQPACPAPAAPSRSMHGMKIGIVAAVAITCLPAILWYGSMTKPPHGQIDLPSKGAVSAIVSVFPAGTAEIFLNGKHCPTPCRTSLPPGPVEVKAQAPRSEPLVRQVVIPDGAAVTIEVHLEKGTVTVH